MKTRYEITMDYNRVMSMTSELESLGESFRRVAADQSRDAIRNLGGSWQGENYSAFMRKAETALDDANEIAEFICNMARQIRSNARYVYNAEMEAVRLAEERNYR